MMMINPKSIPGYYHIRKFLNPGKSRSMMIFLAGFTAVLYFSIVDVSAQGNFQVTPKRLIFEDSIRSLNLNIDNTGESTFNLTISDLKLQSLNETNPRLIFLFKRSGNISFYGDLAVVYTSLQGKLTRVGTAKGVAVYSPESERRFQISLNKIPGVNFRFGTLRVIYTSPSDVKPVIYAESELVLH